MSRLTTLLTNVYLLNQIDMKICIIEECNEKHRSNGFCEYHYDVERRKGGSLHVAEKKRRTFERCLKDAGWSEERFIAFNYAQGGLCYFCGEVSYQNGKPMRLCMDHNHKNGEPRGLLCQRCNQFLWFYEDPDRAKAAETYLGRL